MEESEDDFKMRDEDEDDSVPTQFRLPPLESPIYRNIDSNSFGLGNITPRRNNRISQIKTPIRNNRNRITVQRKLDFSENNETVDRELINEDSNPVIIHNKSEVSEDVLGLGPAPTPKRSRHHNPSEQNFDLHKYPDYSKCPPVKCVYYKPGKYLKATKKVFPTGYSCRCCGNRCRRLKDTPPGYQFIGYTIQKEEQKKFENWDVEFPISENLVLGQGTNNLRPSCIKGVNSLNQFSVQSYDSRSKETGNVVCNLAAKIVALQNQVKSLTEDVERITAEMNECDETFFDRGESDENVYRKCLSFVAENLVSEEKNIVNGNFIKRGNEQYLHPRCNLENLAKFDYEDDWNERDGTILHDLLDEIERVATRRTDNYQYSENAIWSRLCAKQSATSSIQKVINLRCVTPFKLLNSLFLRQFTQSKKMATFCSHLAISQDLATLEVYLIVQVKRHRRKTNVIFTKFRVQANSLPKQIRFRIYQSDNDQIIVKQNRKSLMTDNPTFIYIMNMRTITEFLVWKIDEDFVKIIKPEDISFDDVHTKHEKLDLQRRYDFLKEVFPIIMAQRNLLDRVLETVVEEHSYETEIGDDISDLLWKKFEPTIRRTCEDCESTTDDIEAKKCQHCDGKIKSNKNAEYEYGSLIGECRYHIKKEVKNEDKKYFPGLKMDGYSDKYVENKTTDVFKGRVGNPNSKKGTKGLVNNIQDDMDRHAQKNGVFGVDGSPLINFRQLKLVDPELYSHYLSRLCFLHDCMEQQQIIVRFIRKLCPHALDILKRYKSETKKNRLESNASFRETRDLCITFFKVVFYEMKLEMEYRFSYKKPKTSNNESDGETEVEGEDDDDDFEEIKTKITDGEMFVKYYKRLVSEHKSSVSCIFFDLLADRADEYVDSRRGDYERLESGIRRTIPWLWSDFFRIYQIIKCGDENNLERTKVGHGELHRCYSSQLLHPTKGQLEGHQFQATGAILEEKNGGAKDTTGRFRPTPERWDMGSELYGPM